MNRQVNQRFAHLSRTIFAFLLCAATFTACKKDEEPALPIPTVSNVEIGLGNNEIGVIGKDFHLNVEVLAGDKIENVQIKILPKAGETYAKAWQHEITWTDSYQGVKNATVHKHFDIPADAPEGKYDFLIIVKDQNGTKLEEKRNVALYLEKNLPVNPVLSIFLTYRNNARYYRNGAFITPGQALIKGDTIKTQATISGVKGDGKMYLLLINKKHNHRPESIDKIDFSKAIVYDVLEHKGMATVGDFSNATFDLVSFKPIRVFPAFAIGAANDNNTPSPSPVSGAKAWESGTYYYGVIYKNTTYNMSFFQYIEVPVEIK
ncbi:DUF4625 domain-containing protein [Spirosoma aerolatum]|uniref:DUF4625 domain-containing protein n=1 Tax=Spirosoma aerolatum TaxID=1211326 RepID=UPI0009AE1F2E|nr:DUF4625 domain-containing protein [Spirosoma aerolatum]